MKILAVETSCDETAIAVAEFGDGRGHTRTHPSRTDADKAVRVNVWSHIVSSQATLHAKFGGVVPNLAKREHQKNLVTILREVLRGSRIKDQESRKKKGQIRSLDSKSLILNAILEREPELFSRFKKRALSLPAPDIDAIAVTYGPGLAPALWVGINFARALACLWDKPLIPVNHMAGHIYSAWLRQGGEIRIPKSEIRGKSQIQNYEIPSMRFPLLALLVSGGHTELVLMRGHGKFEIIGETRDDAAGEAFDKVARILGLGYPGGPEISRLAERGDPRKYPLPSPMINTKDHNFSFSGLKTAVVYLVRDSVPIVDRHRKADIAASFQKAAVDVLVKKTVRAAKEHGSKTILLGGGVAANAALRRELSATLKKEMPDAMLFTPDLSLTGDNALMIAAAAYFSKKKMAWSDALQADANLRL